MKELSTKQIVEIVQKFNPYIMYCSNKFFLKGATKEDLFQEGIIGLLEACNNYNGEVFDDRFSSFAKLCIKRQMIDAVKKANAKKNEALNMSFSIEAGGENENRQSLIEIWKDRTLSNDPLDLFLDKEKINERLEICEDQLSPFEKEVLKYYLSGQKQSDIAKTLKKDKKSIDNTMQRIKQKLK